MNSLFDEQSYNLLVIQLESRKLQLQGELQTLRKVRKTRKYLDLYASESISLQEFEMLMCELWGDK